MAVFCLICGDPLGTRRLLQTTQHCDRCDAQGGGKPKKAQTGLFKLVEEIERRKPLNATGKLILGGSGPDEA